MPTIKLIPCAGINNTAADVDLMRPERPAFVRDAVNVDITESGRIQMRKGFRKVGDKPYKNLWQSSLHKDVFATLGDKWVKLDIDSDTHQELEVIGEGDAYHAVLDNRVIVSAPRGLFVYDGVKAERLTIDTPPVPFVSIGGGSLPAGRYGLAVSWLRGGKESGASRISFVDVEDGSGLSVTLPSDYLKQADSVNLYCTNTSGGELLLIGTYDIQQVTVDIPSLPSYGRLAAFDNLEPMKAGKWLAQWRGRLINADANILRFSEPQAYHLHSEQYGFIQLGQRITFVVPVDGGIWVGQQDHVVFLSGATPAELVLNRKASAAPVYGSAIAVSSAFIGGDVSQGGATAAIWLAENGYVVGTPSGSIIEQHAGVISNLSAESGNSVVLGNRVFSNVK